MRVGVALDLQDDRQYQRPRRVAQLQDQIGAELHRDELIERALDHLDRRVRRHLQVEEPLEQVRGERRVVTEHLDQTIVLKRGHRWVFTVDGVARQATGATR